MDYINKSNMEVIDLTGPVPSAKKRVKLSGWVASSFQDEMKKEELAPSVRKRKFSRNSSSEMRKVDPNETWLDRYAPKTTDELAVHKKKVLEVDSWLTQHATQKKGGAPILLITGPPGCGKTTTLMVVAKKHGIQVEEWTNPLTTPYVVSKQAGLKYESQNTQFEEFLFRSGKYCSVLLNEEQKQDSARKVILLEELPNFIYQDPTCFKDILSKYKLTQRWPLVLIISDGTASDPIKRQLRDITSKMATISFNLISATLMTKALNRISLAENRPISKDELSMMSSCGDIRAAINGLQFASQLSSIKDLSIKQGKLRKTKPGSMCTSAKDTTLILFRALGKIFYCKREKRKEPNEFNDTDPRHRDPLLIQPEVILDQCCLSGNAFSLFLHHNYLGFHDNNPIDDITTASEYLSLSDLMNSPLTSSDPSSGAATHLDRYEGVLASRGLIYANSLRATTELCSKSTGTWRPMHKPSWYQVRRQEQENSTTAHCLFWKQQEALPYLVHLAGHFDPSQRNFLREVIALPKWRSFRSSDDRLTEHEVGSDCLNITLSETSSGDVKATKTDFEDEEIVIDEDSD